MCRGVVLGFSSFYPFPLSLRLNNKRLIMQLQTKCTKEVIGIILTDSIRHHCIADDEPFIIAMQIINNKSLIVCIINFLYYFSLSLTKFPFSIFNNYMTETTGFVMHPL